MVPTCLEEKIKEFISANPRYIGYFSLDGSFSNESSQEYPLKVKASDTNSTSIGISFEKPNAGDPIGEFGNLLQDGASVIVTFICDQEHFERMIRYFHWKDGSFDVDDSVMSYQFSVVKGDEIVIISTTHGPRLTIEHKSEDKSKRFSLDKYFLTSDTREELEEIDIRHQISEIGEFVESEYESVAKRLGFERPETSRTKNEMGEAMLYLFHPAFRNSIGLAKTNFFVNIQRLTTRGVVKLPFEITPDCKVEYRLERFYPLNLSSDERDVLSGINAASTDVTPNPETDHISIMQRSEELGTFYNIQCKPGKPYGVEFYLPIANLGQGLLDQFLKDIGIKS